MGIKLVDEIFPMGSFPVTKSQYIECADGTDLETKLSTIGGGGTSITVDTAMSSTSTNPVQNKVIKAYVDGKSVDISADSDNAIQTKTDGIYVEKTKISTDDGNALSKKNNGLFVEDLSNKVNALNIAQKTVNSELEYYYATKTTSISGVSIKHSNLINYLSYLTNITSNLESSRYNTKGVTLKKSKTYRITFGLARVTTSGNGTSAYVMDSDGNKLGNRGYFGSNSYSDNIIDVIYTPTKDISVYPALVNLNTNLESTYYPDCSFFQITEIGREVIIDPVEYVNSTKGIEDTPVGHIIPYMGNNAPKHYLICDGGEYNIVDYPYLAQHFTDEFGSVNYFGGDGTTTFAVPDLRGEFLRGTGTATRNSGSGANVGVHQDGTDMPNYWYDKNNVGMSSNLDDTSTNHVTNVDSKIVPTGTKISYNNNASSIFPSTMDHVWAFKFTTRPTNTSVLYCIKYEPTYFMKYTYSADSVYSTDEMIIGRWIDGKPLYRKVVQTIISDGGIVLSDANCILVRYEWYAPSNGIKLLKLPSPNTGNAALWQLDNGNIVFNIPGSSDMNGKLATCILEYTKTTD